MALADLAQPTSVPGAWSELVWPAFERTVLELLGAACKRLQDAHTFPFHSHWEERDISWAMSRYMEGLCIERGLSYSVRYDRHVLSDADFIAGASPKDAPLIDVCVRWTYSDPEVYFGIEAKILVGRAFRGYKPSDTVNLYVTEGVRRFVDSKYSSSLPAAAMVGYVLNGDPFKCAERINKRIRATHLKAGAIPCHRLLDPGLARLSGFAVYTSVHPRGSDSAITLHHVFVATPLPAES